MVYVDREIKKRFELINQDILPKGYKRTKAGIIPSNWECKKINEIAELNPPKVVFKESMYVSFIGMADVSEDGKIINNHKVHYQEVSTGYTSFKQNDILVAKITPCFENGKGALAMNLYNEIGFGSTEFHVIRVKKKSDRDLVYFHTLTKKFRENGKNHMEGTAGHRRIPSNFIKKYMLPYPNNPCEKQKIANVISTWDKGIKLKEKLIIQNKEKSRGLMQKLLIGKVRLNGFNQDWKTIKLGDVLKERTERGYDNLELLSITFSEGVIKRSELDRKNTSSNDKSKYKRIKPLDIGYNTMRMWQGVCGVSEYEGIVSPAYTILKPTDKIDPYYMGYLFKLPGVINLFYRYSQGIVNDTLNLKYNNFKIIKVKIPADIDEQKAIARILKTQDKEIELLKKEVEALKEQKKGLMQLLLTGKVRVKIDSNSQC